MDGGHKFTEISTVSSEKWDISVHKCVERDYKYIRKGLALPHTTDFRLKRRQIAEITVFCWSSPIAKL